MGQVRWSEPTVGDLRDIVSFVAKDSPAYAVKLANRISEAPHSPDSGRSWMTSSPKYSTDVRRSLVSDVSTPSSLMISGCSSSRTRITPGYSIRIGLAFAQDCHPGLVATNRKPDWNRLLTCP